MRLFLHEIVYLKTLLSTHSITSNSRNEDVRHWLRRLLLLLLLWPLINYSTYRSEFLKRHCTHTCTTSSVCRLLAVWTDPGVIRWALGVSQVWPSYWQHNATGAFVGRRWPIHCLRNWHQKIIRVWWWHWRVQIVMFVKNLSLSLSVDWLICTWPQQQQDRYNNRIAAKNLLHRLTTTLAHVRCSLVRAIITVNI